MILAVIPSRYLSKRFPGKALVPVDGVPLVVRVVQQVIQARVAQRVLVATDHQGIADLATAAGAEVCISSRPFNCGTDRVAHAVQGDPLGEVVLNVQGDEPLVDAATLRAALVALEGNQIGTVAGDLAGPGELSDADTVKVVKDGVTGQALDFFRQRSSGSARTGQNSCDEVLAHTGIYAFHRAALARFAALPPCPRERQEGLEQLRVMQAGMHIGVGRINSATASVNRPGDVARVERVLRLRDEYND